MSLSSFVSFSFSVLSSLKNDLESSISEVRSSALISLSSSEIVFLKNPRKTKALAKVIFAMIKSSKNCKISYKFAYLGTNIEENASKVLIFAKFS